MEVSRSSLFMFHLDNGHPDKMDVVHFSLRKSKPELYLQRQYVSRVSKECHICDTFSEHFSKGNLGNFYKLKTVKAAETF